MSSALRAEPADDAFLDELFDCALREASDGRALDPDAAAVRRPHLLPEIRRLIDVARALAVRRPLALPEVPGYALLGLIGRGAMGAVYLARQRSLRRVVALKVLPVWAGVNSSTRERFLAEARALARLRDEHIVAVHDVVDTGAACAFAMDWIEGRSLAEVLAILRGLGRAPRIEDVRAALAGPEGSPAATDTGVYFCRLALAIARALSAVHTAGLLHRDVKPSNILLRRDGAALLSDFGVARGTEQDWLTRTGQFLGTPVYAAPEQLRAGADGLDARADVYSLGVTLYECLSLRLPFKGRSSAELLARVEGGLSIPLRKVNAAISRDLETIVHKAMEPDPRRRYATAADLAADLERLLALQPIRARPAGPLRRALKLARRHRNMLAAWAVGGLLAGAASLAIVWHQRERASIPARVQRHLDGARAALIERMHQDGAERFSLLRSNAGAAWPAAATDPIAAYDAALELDPAREDIRVEREVVAAALAPERVPRGLDPLLRARCPETARQIERLRAGEALQGPDPSLLRRFDPHDVRALGLLAYLLDDAEVCMRAWAGMDLGAASDTLVDASSGQLLLNLGWPALAYPRLLRAHDAYPQVAALAVDLAEAAWASGDWASGARYAARARELAPSVSLPVLDELQASFAPKEFNPAEVSMNNAFWLASHGGSADREARLGLFHERRGNFERAARHLSLALHSKPGAPDLTRAFSRACSSWWRSLDLAGRVEALAEALRGADASWDPLALWLSLATEQPAPGSAAQVAGTSRRDAGEHALTRSLLARARPDAWRVGLPRRRVLSLICLLGDELAARLLGGATAWRAPLLALGAAGLDALRTAGLDVPSTPANAWSLRFDGIDDIAFVGYHPGMDLGGDYTVELWFRGDSVPLDEYRVLFSKFQGHAEDRRLSVGETRSHYNPGCFGSGGWDESDWVRESAPGVPASRWTHVAMLQDGTQSRLYFNGHLVHQGRMPSVVPCNSNGGIFIGGTFNGASFRGEIAAVRYSRVARYGQDFAPQPAWAPDERDILNVPLEEAAGDAFRDVGPLGCAGSLTGGPAWVSMGPATELYAVAPSVGAADGGGEVTLHGVLFGDPSRLRVEFGENLVEVLHADHDRLVVRAPAGTAGTSVGVRVAGEHGAALLDQAYTFR